MKERRAKAHSKGANKANKELEQFKSLILRFVATDGADTNGQPPDTSQQKRGTSNGFYREGTNMRRQLLDLSASERA